MRAKSGPTAEKVGTEDTGVVLLTLQSDLQCRGGVCGQEAIVAAAEMIHGVAVRGSAGGGGGGAEDFGDEALSVTPQQAGAKTGARGVGEEVGICAVAGGEDVGCARRGGGEIESPAGEHLF